MISVGVSYEYMIPVVCKRCGTKFAVKPCHHKMGQGKYCSMECLWQSQRTGRFVPCEICGKEAWKAQRALKNSKSQKFFCSKSCQTKWRNSVFIGEKHANWCGGEFTYHRVMAEHKIPAVCHSCGIIDRRVLVIHHLDRNRKHNTIENLMWLCRNCHHLIHNGKTF